MIHLSAAHLGAGAPAGDHGPPVHNRQFMLGPASVVTALVPGRYEIVDMGDGAALCVDPALSVRAVSDADGRPWWVLGRAADTDANDGDAAVTVARLRTDEVARASTAWSGRWLLLSTDRIIPDGASLLGCYVTMRPGLPAPVVSSSLGLLRQLVPRRPPPPRPLRRFSFLSYRIPPTTELVDTRKLLAGQVLRWRDGTVEPGILCPEATGAVSQDALVQRFGARLAASLHHLSAPAKTIWLTLTAGHDSRLMLAAALRQGLPVRTVTLGYTDMSEADRRLPPAIARAVGVEHRFVAPAHRVRRHLNERWDRHTGEGTFELDRLFHARGQYRFLREGDVLVRAGCVETSTESHVAEFPEYGPLATDLPPSDHILRGLRAQVTPEMIEEINGWRSWVDQTADRGLDWRLRLYWEARLGGWLSNVEQGLDLLEGVSVQPANCALLHAEALHLPADMRAAFEHQEALVEQWTPGIADLPYNPAEAFWRRVRRRLMFIASELWSRRPR